MKLIQSQLSSLPMAPHTFYSQSSTNQQKSSRPLLNKKDLTRSLHTALLSSKISGIDSKDASLGKLHQLSETPAFDAILSAITKLSSSQGIDEMDAAKEIVHTFGQMDQLWNQYLLQAGMAEIKSSK